MMNIDTVRYWGACKAEAISKRDSSLTLGTSSAIYDGSPSPSGRELEGGGNSPSPYSSPIKGEETFLGLLCSQLRLPRLRLAMTNKKARSDRE